MAGGTTSQVGKRGAAPRLATANGQWAGLRGVERAEPEAGTWSSGGRPPRSPRSRSSSSPSCTGIAGCCPGCSWRPAPDLLGGRVGVSHQGRGPVPSHTCHPRPLSGTHRKLAGLRPCSRGLCRGWSPLHRNTLLVPLPKGALSSVPKGKVSVTGCSCQEPTRGDRARRTPPHSHPLAEPAITHRAPGALQPPWADPVTEQGRFQSRRPGGPVPASHPSKQHELYA